MTEDRVGWIYRDNALDDQHMNAFIIVVAKRENWEGWLVASMGCSYSNHIVTTWSLNNSDSYTRLA